MSRKEIALIESHLRPTDQMLEWGAGGSTLHFSKLVKSYLSIEHHEKWFYRVKAKLPENAELILKPPNQKLPALFKGKCTREMFLDYVEAPFQRLIKKKFDRVLVDGRARVACSMEVIPHLQEGGLIFVHDFFKRLKSYGSLLDHFDIVDEWRKDQSVVALALRK